MTLIDTTSTVRPPRPGASWHVNPFPNPVSEPAKRVAELCERRRELRRESADTAQAQKAARAEQTAVSDQIKAAEAHELAFGDAGELKALRAKATKAAARVIELADRLDKLELAIQTVDAHITAVCIDNLGVLRSEIVSEYRASADRYLLHLASLEAEAAVAKSHIARMLTLLNGTGQDSSILRDVAPNRALRDYVQTGKELIPSSPWTNSAMAAEEYEQYRQRVDAARRQVEQELADGERTLRGHTMGEPETGRFGMEEAIWEVMGRDEKANTA